MAARPYNTYAWRHVVTIRILRRDGGAFARPEGSRRERYAGQAQCQRCGKRDPFTGGRRRFHVCHLVIPAGEPGHDADHNLAVLCPKCHKAHDRPSWARKLAAYFLARAEQRIIAKDLARPILVLAEGGPC